MVIRVGLVFMAVCITDQCVKCREWKQPGSREVAWWTKTFLVEGKAIEAAALHNNMRESAVRVIEPRFEATTRVVF